MSEPFRKTIRVRCSPEHAFEVFTGRLDLWWPPGHRRFDRSQMSLEMRVGGRFVERSDAGEEADLGEILRWEPPNRLTYTWRPGAITQPTQVDVRSSGDGDQTLVEVTHSEGAAAMGDAWPERVALFGRSWQSVLAAFEDHLHPDLRQAPPTP